jgi:hypothetical protein
MTDDELLTFDYERLAGNERPESEEHELGGLHDHWTRGDAAKALEIHGEVYRAQLVAAHFAERWCEEQLAHEREMPVGRSADYLAGFEMGLRDMAAHLRKGDLLPGGTLYRFEMTQGGGSDA